MQCLYSFPAAYKAFYWQNTGTTWHISSCKGEWIPLFLMWVHWVSDAWLVTPTITPLYNTLSPTCAHPTLYFHWSFRRGDKKNINLFLVWLAKHMLISILSKIGIWTLVSSVQTRSFSQFKAILKINMDQFFHLGRNPLQGPWLGFQVTRPGWWEFLSRPGGKTQTTPNIPPTKPLFGSKWAH